MIVAVAAVLLGSGLVLVAVTVGRCDAFGGRCPADRGPLLEDDVFGTAAIGGALIAAVPTFLYGPSRRRLATALSAGAVAAVLVGLAARSAAG